MMSRDDSEPVSMTAPEPVPAIETSGEPPGKTETASLPGPGGRIWAIVLAMGLAAGVIAWACAEAMLIPETGVGRRGGNIRALPAVAATRNAMVSFGILGAALGLSLGLTGGLIRRSGRSATLAAVIGLILGGVAGAGAARSILPVYYEHLMSIDLTYSLLVHATVGTAIGAAVGLAFGLGMGGFGSMLRGLLGGAGAAMLAAMIYEFAGGILFPLAMTDQPLSKTWQTRLLARLLVSGMAAAGALLCGWREKV